jgi:hypothetical protein
MSDTSTDTRHTVDFTVGDDPQVYRTFVTIIPGYSTLADTPKIIRIAIMDMSGKFKGAPITPDDVHVFAVDGVPTNGTWTGVQA